MSDQRYCQTQCLAEAFQLKELHGHLAGKNRVSLYRDALLLEIEKGRCVIFQFGVCVFWNCRQEWVDRLTAELAPFTVGQACGVDIEHFSYGTGHDMNRIFHDHIELIDDRPLNLLAISYAFAQSVKLSVFENQVVTTIRDTSGIPRKLASEGRTALSRKQTAKMRGKLFLTKSEIILRYDLLDKPEFFWEYPELDSLYQMGANYLELDQRTRILTLKLGTISELLDMLDDDQKHRHSSKLEWIIIWLIAVEIIIFLVNDFMLK